MFPAAPDVRQGKVEAGEAGFGHRNVPDKWHAFIGEPTTS
jgi:hypothetical protein